MITLPPTFLPSPRAKGWPITRTTRCCAAAVERNFEIIEALSQALKFFPQSAGRFTDEQPIIAFRNRLIHGYATVRHALVWEIVQTKLPQLQKEVAQLLRETAEASS